MGCCPTQPYFCPVKFRKNAKIKIKMNSLLHLSLVFWERIANFFHTFLLGFERRSIFCTHILTFWIGHRNMLPFNNKSLLGMLTNEETLENWKKKHYSWGKNKVFHFVELPDFIKLILHYLVFTTIPLPKKK